MEELDPQHGWQNRTMDARYSRQLALPGFGVAGQEALANARVLVIGAGGLGSTVIPALAAAGVGTIGIVDDDVVELSNLHRQQVHDTADVGLAKVASARARIAAMNPTTTVAPVEERLTRVNALKLFDGYDLVLDGSDNFPTRYLANDAAVLTDIPLVWGSVSQYSGQAGVSWGITYRDLFPTPPPPGSVLSCEAGGVMPSTVAVIGSIMTGEAIKILTGIGEPLIGRVLIFDGLTASMRELRYQRDPSAAPITALIDYQAFCGFDDAHPEEDSLHDTNTIGPTMDASAPAPTPNTVDASQLAARHASIARHEVTLLDVREPWEAEVAQIADSTLIPLGELPGSLERIDKTRPVIVYCHHGVRSQRALDLLLSNGFDASHLTGGIDAWAAEREPDMARY